MSPIMKSFQRHLPIALTGLTLLAGPLASGCAAEAPEGIDNLARFMWDRFDPAEGLDAGAQETEIREAVDKMRAEYRDLDLVLDEGDRGKAFFTGTLPDLEEERIADLEGVGDRAKDIELGQGFVLANLTNCSIQQQVNLLMSNRSIEIHPDVYESYDKDFDSDESAFRDGDTNFITYKTAYKIQTPPVGSPYSAKLNAAARRINTDDGEIVITRVYLSEAAKFDGEGSSFDLDFQMEVYFDLDGETGHFYTMWRRMVLGPVDNSSELFISQTLGGFQDWELEVDDACAAGILDD